MVAYSDESNESKLFLWATCLWDSGIASETRLCTNRVACYKLFVISRSGVQRFLQWFQFRASPGGATCACALVVSHHSIRNVLWFISTLLLQKRTTGCHAGGHLWPVGLLGCRGLPAAATQLLLLWLCCGRLIVQMTPAVAAVFLLLTDIILMWCEQLICEKSCCWVDRLNWGLWAHTRSRSSL